MKPLNLNACQIFVKVVTYTALIQATMALIVELSNKHIIHKCCLLGLTAVFGIKYALEVFCFGTIPS